MDGRVVAGVQVFGERGRAFAVLGWLVILVICGGVFAAEYHVWEKVAVTLLAEKAYEDAYNDVGVWVDLSGPGFEKRCYGFWNGRRLFRVCILVTRAGHWSWRSGSNQRDSGLNGKMGGYTAVDWSAAQKLENRCRAT